MYSDLNPTYIDIISVFSKLSLKNLTGCRCIEGPLESMSLEIAQCKVALRLLITFYVINSESAF